MKAAFISLFLAAGQSLVAASALFEGGPVEALTPEKASKIGDKEPLLALYYRPTCGHCKAMAPKFKKAANDLVADLRVGAIDCDAHSKGCKDEKVPHFPHVVFKSGGKSHTYDGDRNTEAYKSWALKQLSKAGKKLGRAPMKSDESLEDDDLNKAKNKVEKAQDNLEKAEMKLEKAKEKLEKAQIKQDESLEDDDLNKPKNKLEKAQDNLEDITMGSEEPEEEEEEEEVL